jgi:integrase
MTNVKLSDNYVRSLVCAKGQRPFVVTDRAGGLSVRVSPSSKTWRFRYTFGGRQRTPLTIGAFPAVTAFDARKAVQGYEELLSKGHDPRHAGYQPIEAPCLGDVLDHYLATLANPATNRNATSAFKSIRAAHGLTKVQDLNRRLLKDWLEENYPDRPGALRTLVAYLTSAFNRAQDSLSGLRLPPGFENPSARLESKLKPLRDSAPGSYATSFEPTTIKRLFDACSEAYAKCDAPQGIMVLELLLRTGARPTEIASLRMKEITDHGTYMVIVKDQHKTWATTRRPRRIVLTSEAREIVLKAKEHSAFAGDYLFPQRRRQKNQKNPHIAAFSHYAEKLGKAAGVPFTAYNLRSAFINFAMDHLGYEWLDTIAENVGHTDPKTTLKYYRKFRDGRLVEAAELVALALSGVQSVGHDPLQSLH